MIYEVFISRQAEDDIRGIYEYIAIELMAPANASGQLDRLEKSIDSLGFLPFKFTRYGKEPWKSKGLRVLPIDKYLVFYIPDTKTHTVTVLRVLYGGRDVEKELGE